MRSRPVVVGVVTVVGLVLFAGCASDDSGDSTPDLEAPGAVDSAADGGAVIDDGQLRRELTPVVSPLGWEIQRTYRQDAFLVGQNVELVNVYLRPSGAQPSSEQYVAALADGVQAVASRVFESDGSVTAVDVCLQYANDAPTTADVAPAVRMLGLREDLVPLLEREVQLADLVAVEREGRLVLFADEAVRQTSAWSSTVGEAGLGSGDEP